MAQVTLKQLHSAKKSIAGRLRGLKTVGNYWDGKKSPIVAIKVFDYEVEKMESILMEMKRRLDSAKITIEV